MLFCFYFKRISLTVNKRVFTQGVFVFVLVTLEHITRQHINDYGVFELFHRIEDDVAGLVSLFHLDGAG